MSTLNGDYCWNFYHPKSIKMHQIECRRKFYPPLLSGGIYSGGPRWWCLWIY